jgi:hypothetical protein
MKQLVEQVIELLQQEIKRDIVELKAIQEIKRDIVDLKSTTDCDNRQAHLLVKLQLITELEKYKYTVMSSEEKQQLMQSLCSYDSVLFGYDKYTKVELTDATITKLANVIREIL